MEISPVYPCLWFDGNAIEAVEFYCSIFPDSKIVSQNPFVVIFHIKNTKFMALNGGPEYKFNGAISFVVNCNNQQEIDYFWEKLSSGGQIGKCGWLQDKFGVSWQIVPTILGKLMNNPDKAPKVMFEFMQMTKFDIEKLLKI